MLSTILSFLIAGLSLGMVNDRVIADLQKPSTTEAPPAIVLGGPAPYQVVQGGTGWANVQSGRLLYGNGTGKLATTSAGTAGQVLALLGGIPTWTATTTFGTGLTYSGGNVTLDATGSWTGTFDGLEGSAYLANSFSTTSADYWKTQRDFFSTTSAIYFAHSSTTIPKTYTANTFSLLQTFAFSSTTYGSFTTASSTRWVGGGLTDCDADNQTLGWDATTMQFTCGDDDTGAGGTGITDLGPVGQQQTGTSQLFATSSDTNVGLTITSSGDTHTFTSNWIGTLADSRVSDTLTIGASGSVADGALSANVSLLGQTIGVAELASADFGDFTCNGATCTLDQTYMTSYDAFTHPQAGTSATTSGMIFTAASSTFTGGLSVLNGTTTNATSTNLNVSGQVDFDTLTSALLLTGAGGVLAEFAGSSCTNQAATAISALGAFTCSSITNAYFADADWGDITIAGGSAAVEDDSHAHTSATISGLDISADTNLAVTYPLVLTNDTLSTAFGTTTHQIFSSAYFTLASSTHATTSSLYIGSHHATDFFEFTMAYHGTTTQGVGTTTKPATRTMLQAGTVVSTSCYFNKHMRVLVQDKDGNRMDDLVASSTTGTFTFSTNNTFTAGEPLEFYVGTTTAGLGNVYGSCTFKARYD